MRTLGERCAEKHYPRGPVEVPHETRTTLAAIIDAEIAKVGGDVELSIAQLVSERFYSLSRIPEDGLRLTENGLAELEDEIRPVIQAHVAARLREKDEALSDNAPETEGEA